MTRTIATRDLTLRYDTTTAVDDLSVELAGGAIHGILGRNGSGKTSLLSVLAAFRPATAGEVTVDGQPVFENPEVVRDICFIRGAGDTVVNDWPGDRVENAMAFAAWTRPRWDARFADELLERFEVPPHSRLSELSRGQRSAVGIALGLASRAPITMFDESYLGLDAPSRYAFYDLLLADFAEHPRTYLISTHLIEEVASLFEQVLIIDRGQRLFQGDPDDLRERGVSVTGPSAEVERFTAGMDVLNSKQLGPTRQVTAYGVLDPAARRAATSAGLELGPVPLQDLFVHLTDPERRSAETGSPR